MHPVPLHQLLDAGLAFGPEFGSGLSNHLPMALCALHGIGASDARLHGFFDHYASKLKPAAPPSAPLPHWQSQLGQLDAYPALVSTFQAALQQQGVAPLLRRVLPDLMPGVAAAAFHGLILLAYAVKAQHQGEMAAGLAYWACRYLPLGEPRTTTQPGLPIAAWLGQLASALHGWHSEHGLIAQRMQAAAQHAGYQRLAGQLALQADTLAQLSAWAAERYCASRSFTVLHLVTSCHALRLLLPYLDEPQIALGHYARAYAAGLIASGIAPDQAPPPSQLQAWAALLIRAAASDNDHVIKLAYSCHEESRVYPGEVYRKAATLLIGG